MMHMDYDMERNEMHHTGSKERRKGE